MKYYEVEFTINPLSEDACDLLAAMAGEAGFETFEETERGIKGYVQQTLFSEDNLIATGMSNGNRRGLNRLKSEVRRKMEKLL